MSVVFSYTSLLVMRGNPKIGLVYFCCCLLFDDVDVVVAFDKCIGSGILDKVKVFTHIDCAYYRYNLCLFVEIPKLRIVLWYTNI